MYVGGMLLSFVALLRTFTGVGLFTAAMSEAPPYAVVPVTAVVCSVAYLAWVGSRGRRELRDEPVPQRARSIVVGYAVVALGAIPLGEILVYRAV